ncbi:MAG: hypothetical protein BWZ09_01666 [Alphaproteobacteria bacterium ADurb.BinA305]|nr:MAG: hypothetical protein BWZ09_01666 [Alphaproteobacteria bacterium ADurb.BinA305]
MVRAGDGGRSGGRQDGRLGLAATPPARRRRALRLRGLGLGLGCARLDRHRGVLGVPGALGGRLRHRLRRQDRRCRRAFDGGLALLHRGGDMRLDRPPFSRGLLQRSCRAAATATATAPRLRSVGGSLPARAGRRAGVLRAGLRLGDAHGRLGARGGTLHHQGLARHGELLAHAGCGQPRAGAGDEDARLLVAAEFQQAARLRFLEQVAEGAEAEVALVEIGLAALDRLLEHRGPDLAALAAFGEQRVEGLDGNVDRLAAARLELLAAGLVLLGLLAAGGRVVARLALGCGALAVAHEVVVEDELVAVGDQQVGGGLLDPDADHLLGVLAQLGHQRREVRVAADDHEGVDMRLGVAQVERVDHEPDVGRILAGLAHVGDLDELEVGLVHRRLEALVAVPVAIGLLDHDAALEQQALEHPLDVELLVLRVPHAQRHVLEVAEQRHADAVGGGSHGNLRF